MWVRSQDGKTIVDINKFWIQPSTEYMGNSSCIMGKGNSENVNQLGTYSNPDESQYVLNMIYASLTKMLNENRYYIFDLPSSQIVKLMIEEKRDY